MKGAESNEPKVDADAYAEHPYVKQMLDGDTEVVHKIKRKTKTAVECSTCGFDESVHPE